MKLRASWGVSFLFLIITACGGDGGKRSIDQDKPEIGIENPNADGVTRLLNLSFRVQILDDGQLQFSIAALLPDLTLDGLSKWSDSELLGEQFQISVGEQGPFLMTKSTSTPAVKQATGAEEMFTMQSPLQPISAAAFMSLHSAALKIRKIDQGEQSFHRSVNTPQALALYEQLNALPLTDRQLSRRILTNCNINTGQPDSINWKGASSQKFQLDFMNLSQAILKTFLVDDSTRWNLTEEVFGLYFSAAELQELNTQDPDFGYPTSDPRTIRIRMARNSQLHRLDLETSPRQTLPVLVTAEELANYRLEYQGGCNP